MAWQRCDSKKAKEKNIWQWAWINKQSDFKKLKV